MNLSTRHSIGPAIVGAIFLLTVAISSGPTQAQNQAANNVPPPVDQKICVSLNLIEETEILSDREVILALRDGKILALRMSESCPQLKYHGTFTYRATAGQLCAGEDKIVTRSGDACTISTFALIDSHEKPE